jgi:hypothetical protein
MMIIMIMMERIIIKFSYTYVWIMHSFYLLNKYIVQLLMDILIGKYYVINNK